MLSDTDGSFVKKIQSVAYQAEICSIKLMSQLILGRLVWYHKCMFKGVGAKSILRKGSRIYLPVLGIGFESWFGFEFLIVEIEEGNETSSANQKLRRGAIESSEMESSLGGGKQPLDV